jgi:hypothetical protein
MVGLLCATLLGIGEGILVGFIVTLVLLLHLGDKLLNSLDLSLGISGCFEDV